MSRYHSYLATAITILRTHGYAQPLSYHLKHFFSAEKKYGAKDRKTISSLCYYCYRLGKAFTYITIEEKILSGLFLCEDKSNPLLESLRPDLNVKIELPLPGKLDFLQLRLPGTIFPYQQNLSPEIDAASFEQSFLTQPFFYLRIRPGKKRAVIEQLKKSSLQFESTGDLLILPLQSSVEKVMKIDEDIVVQDMNSQLVLNFLDQFLLKEERQINAWDCCAASGGKSILMADKLGGRLRLTVSDIRENILSNLETRLNRAGVPVSKSFVADLTHPIEMPGSEKFSIIVCDAPCTGSGTWSRTPEQLCFFKEKMIDEYAERQRKIALNSAVRLEKGGLFFYITCSVFRKENEEIVDFIKQELSLQLLEMKYLKGYDKRADTMFVAVFLRN